MIDRDKLGKVLALQASPIDGEALAATRMAVKLLSAAGMRPEDLAKGLVQINTPDLSTFHWRPPAPRPAPAQPWPKPRPTKAEREAAQAREQAAHEAALRELKRQADRMSFAKLDPKDTRNRLTRLLAEATLTAEEQAYLFGIATQLYERPHELLDARDVRRLNRLWRSFLPADEAA
jgi:hypothetical protein